MLSKTVSFLFYVLGLALIIISIIDFDISSTASIIGLAMGLVFLGLPWIAKNMTDTRPK